MHTVLPHRAGQQRGGDVDRLVRVGPIMPALRQGHGCCRRIARPTAGLPGQRGHDLDPRHTGDREDAARPGAVRLRIQPVPVSRPYRFTTALLRSRTAEKACGAARPATLGRLPHQGQGHGPCLRAEPKAESV